MVKGHTPKFLWTIEERITNSQPQRDVVFTSTK
jgi:hypothetical protein